MPTKLIFEAIAVLLVLALVACSDDDDSPDNVTELNPDPGSNITPGEPGGDTTSIAGLWDGSTMVDAVENTVYWNIAADGVLTRYDYQQDGTTASSGENCYMVGDPITLIPEGGDSYSIADVATVIVRHDDNLSVKLMEEDKNDIDDDGDLTETPTFDLTLLATPTLADLNSCSSEGASENDPTTGEGPGLPSGQERPVLTTPACESEGGTVVADIGDGSMFQPDYRCESGQLPIAAISYIEGYIEGAVCCL